MLRRALPRRLRKYDRSTACTRILATSILLALAASTAACGGGQAISADGRILAVGAENQYANVIAQVGGRYVRATAIESNPNTDPHSFEASPAIAKTVAAAELIVQNGLGYDTFMERVESASGGVGSNSSRKVIDVQKLLGLPDSTANPHLWYGPHTMPAVARAVAGELAALQPAHAAYFRANAARFEQSLKPWYRALEQFAHEYPRTPVATTEPVGDYMLETAGTVNMTPFSLQADIMNGLDPAPEDVTLQNELLSARRAKVLLYNQQVTDSLTQAFLEEAKRSGVPVVGVYETMPTPGYDYQSWMLAEVHALQRALAEKRSTEKL
jgi:zinc/manganese transport system substrate-binding protein